MRFVVPLSICSVGLAVFLFVLSRTTSGLADRLMYHPTHDSVRTEKSYSSHIEERWIPVENSIDGARLNAWFASCGCQNSKGLLVYFHGNSLNIRDEFKFVDWFPAQGYDVLSFDYRGFGRSSDVSIHPDSTIEDGKTVLRYANTLGYKKIFVLGQSMGGAVAYTSVAESTDVPVAKMVLDSTFGSYQRIVLRTGETLIPIRGFNSWFGWLVGRFVTERFAPVLHGQRVDIPVLMLHSPSDRVVPFREGYEFFQELPNKVKHFVVVEGGRHVRAFLDFGNTYRKPVIDFLGNR